MFRLAFRSHRWQDCGKKAVDIAKLVDILAVNCFWKGDAVSPILGPRDRKKDKNLAQMGILAIVPTILLVAPMMGYFAGSWADEYFGTEPYLLIVGLVLGFGAAAREIYNLIKRSQALDKEKDDGNDGSGVH